MTMRVTREEFVGSVEGETMEEYLSNAERAGKLMQRPDGTRLFCPFTVAATYCGTWCPMCLFDGIDDETSPYYCGLPLGRSGRMEEVGM